MNQKSLDWIDKIFLINLDRSTKRLEKSMEQAHRYKIPIERFPAVDGRNLSQEQKEYIHPICKYLLCTPSMIGCGLSHFYILKKIVEEKIETSIILEDDFVWRENTIEKINQLKDFQKGIVKLSCIGPFCGEENSQEPICSKFPLGNASYLIRYKDAKKLLNQLKNIKYHIDIQFNFVSLINQIPIYYYDCIDIDGDEESTIGNEKRTWFGSLPFIPNKVRWYMNEPYMAPFGIPFNLFLTITLLFFILGFILLYKRWVKTGVLLILLGILDLFFYLKS